jgi:hypothetical protein
MRVFFVAALLMALAVAAHAAECTKAGRARATRFSDEALKAYRAQRSDDAIEGFKKAYEACASPGYLFNLGQVYRHSNDNEHAVASYKQFLDEADADDGKRPEAEKWIAQLSPPPAPPPPPASPPPPSPPPESPPPPGTTITPATTVPFAKREPSTKLELGVRARYIFVTKLMLQPFLQDNTGTQLNSYSVGMELVYRKSEDFDIVTSIDFSWLAVDDGNYLGSGHDPAADTHYLQFRNLSFLSADVSLIGHHKFLPWLEIRYGGGLGVGWVAGDVLETNNGGQCNAMNAPDTTQCYPRGTQAGTINTGPIVGKPTPAQEQQLQSSTAPDNGTDTSDTPHRHVTNSKPPAMAVVNLLVGVRFYPIPKMAITWEIGFRDAMFTGLGVHYRF